MKQQEVYLGQTPVLLKEKIHFHIASELIFHILFAYILQCYFLQFTSLLSTFQSLLALVNGDEIYVTFTAVDSDKQLVWYFNSFFLVAFLALFTLVTLNIFIAIFNTAYEQQHNDVSIKLNKLQLRVNYVTVYPSRTPGCISVLGARITQVFCV